MRLAQNGAISWSHFCDQRYPGLRPAGLRLAGLRLAGLRLASLTLMLTATPAVGCKEGL